MARGYKIQDFYQAATKFGIARNNAFRIKNISGDAGNFFAGNIGDLLIFAKDGTIPSRVIKTGEVKYKAFNFVVPLEAQYPENQSWKVTFYCDGSYMLRQILEKWSVGTYNEHSNNSTLNWTNCNIELALIDYTNGSMVENRTYTLVGCFPTNIGSLSFDTTSTGMPVTLDMTLAFQYIISGDDSTNVIDGSSFTKNLLSIPAGLNFGRLV